MTEYTQGVCMDGAAILKDGEMMTIEEILDGLREIATLKASLPKIKADAVRECAQMPKWGGQPDDIPADFDGYCQAIHEVHDNANKLEAGE